MAAGADVRTDGPQGAVIPREERCPLCGTSFDAGGQGCRPSCPMARGCAVVCCPSCGYGFPQEVGLAGALRRFLERRKDRKVHT